ncbi:MAG: alpha/beta hydrolase [Candidatus Heimdallarchaeota archaeon]|nr:alpha/beta hydrolase [Candidatus Heimdallarchaeota archaeon]
MIWFWVILSIYILLGLIIFFLINSNLIPSRRHTGYSIEDADLEFIPSSDGKRKLAIWKQLISEDHPTVILLHGFSRDSGKMLKRAEVYKRIGFNIYYIDNLGHGRSSNYLFPSGIQYSFEVRHAIEYLKITNPILHGASMGAIASSYIAQKSPDVPKQIICEALPHDFDNLYPEMMRYMKLPLFLYPFMPWISRKIVWRQFKGLDINFEPWNISCPIFLIHSESDKMFDYKLHFDKIIEKLGEDKSVNYWLVPNAGHTRMDENPKYADMIYEYLLYN